MSCFCCPSVGNSRPRVQGNYYYNTSTVGLNSVCTLHCAVVGPTNNIRYYISPCRPYDWKSRLAAAALMQGIETIEAIGPSGTSSTSSAMRRHNLLPDLVLSKDWLVGLLTAYQTLLVTSHTCLRNMFRAKHPTLTQVSYNRFEAFDAQPRVSAGWLVGDLSFLSGSFLMMIESSLWGHSGKVKQQSRYRSHCA